MARLSPTDGFITHGWMRTHLHLEGADLLTFALVHQFTQSAAGIYKGGIQYLREWTGWSVNTCKVHLRSLVEKGLIEELRGEKNGVPYLYFVLSEDTHQFLTGTHQNLTGGTHQNLTGENTYKDNKEEPITDVIGKKKCAYMARPTYEEVKAYCQEKGIGIDVTAFIEYYTANGWKVGKVPMADWHAAVRNWERRQKQFTPSPAPSPSPRRSAGQACPDPEKYWNK